MNLWRRHENQNLSPKCKASLSSSSFPLALRNSNVILAEARDSRAIWCVSAFGSHINNASILDTLQVDGDTRLLTAMRLTLAYLKMSASSCAGTICQARGKHTETAVHMPQRPLLHAFL